MSAVPQLPPLLLAERDEVAQIMLKAWQREIKPYLNTLKNEKPEDFNPTAASIVRAGIANAEEWVRWGKEGSE